MSMNMRSPHAQNFTQLSVPSFDTIVNLWYVISMSYDNLTPDELAAAKRQVAQYGVRAQEIVNELIACAVSNDHHRGGRLVREMYDEPDKLMLVVGMLTTAVVKGVTGPLATPEQLGIDTDTEIAVEAWEVGAADQLQAASANQDLEVFAKVALDLQIKAALSDFNRHLQETGYYPDAGHLMRALAILDRITVMGLAAESLRRLVMLEIEKGG